MTAVFKIKGRRFVMEIDLGDDFEPSLWEAAFGDDWRSVCCEVLSGHIPFKKDIPKRVCEAAQMDEEFCAEQILDRALRRHGLFFEDCDGKGVEVIAGYWETESDPPMPVEALIPWRAAVAAAKRLDVGETFANIDKYVPLHPEPEAK